MDRVFIRVVKPFRHGARVYQPGEIGEVVTVEEPQLWEGELVYDRYVRFPELPPVGVLKDEVEEVTSLVE